jgi:Tol biopolymer transport system component
MALHERGVVAALAVLLSLAGLSCGREATPEGLIAFSHGVGDDIFVMSLPEGPIRRVTSIRGGQFDPSWSPDRTQLVFRDSRAGVNRNNEIYRIDADGSDIRNLTHETANDWSPAWSPDGETIVFASERSGQLALWAMRPDGSHVGQLTDGVEGGWVRPAAADTGLRRHGSRLVRGRRMARLQQAGNALRDAQGR